MKLRASLTYVLTVLFVLCLAALPRPARAFGLAGVGGKLGYASPEDENGTAEVGVHAELENPGTHLHLLPNVMYWNVDGMRDMAPNMDVYYHFNPQGRMTPYVGGGLGLNFIRDGRRDLDETDLGMNLVGGLRFPGSASHYFLEGRYTASDISQVSVLTGVTFGSR